MDSTQQSPVQPRWMVFDVRYSRSGGWSIACECGRFNTGYESYDTGMFYELREHFRDYHPEQDAEALTLTPFDMRAFVDYFDQQVESAASAKRWIIAIGIALGIGFIPIFWRFADWLASLAS